MTNHPSRRTAHLVAIAAAGIATAATTLGTTGAAGAATLRASNGGSATVVNSAAASTSSTPKPPPSPRTIKRITASALPVQIVNTASNLTADVMWGSTAVGTGTWLWDRTGSQAQLVDLLPSDNGYFRIRVRHSGQCLMLDWRTGPYKDGTKIVQHPYCDTGYAPSQWRRQYVRTSYCAEGASCTAGPTYMRLVNRSTGLCLDADNPAGYQPKVKAALQQWRCMPTTGRFGGNQSWDILRHGQNRVD